MSYYYHKAERLKTKQQKSVLCASRVKERDSNVAHSQRLWLRVREHNTELSNSTGLLITHTYAQIQRNSSGKLSHNSNL